MGEVFAPYKWEALLERWPDILHAFGTTVAISALALVIALVLGFLFGVLSVSRHAVLRGITRVYVELVQNIPLLLQVFVLYAVFPLLGLSLASFWIGVLAIGVYHGGYISEVVRSGIGSIHRGQFEAARSQGFSPVQVMTLIILPQAMRIILPPLAVQAANLVKNTSVLALIAGGELMYFSNSFAGDTSYYGPAYVAAAVLYFVICFPLSRAAVYLEHRMLSHRHVTTGDASEELSADAMEVTPGSHDITGHAAARALAGGITTMAAGTSTLVPARRVPSPRYPLHAWEAAPAPGERLRAVPFTGRQAAEIADDFGLEVAQEALEASGGDHARAWQALHTRAGRRRLGGRHHVAGQGRRTPHGRLPRPRRGEGRRPRGPRGPRGGRRDS
ncbi:MAG: amino acid ABC transporter permease [Eggerthellaceae bacterium]|nr:amino acid ABC transporter permease [Eggerthellaceae bacterium]